jgi:phosphoserine phosphatase
MGTINDPEYSAHLEVGFCVLAQHLTVPFRRSGRGCPDARLEPAARHDQNQAETKTLPQVEEQVSLKGLGERTMTTVILVRHGQTEWNRMERFRGRADVPLNETGLAQARAAGERVSAGWLPVAVYASPLSRAVKTAEAIAIHFNLQVEIHAGLVDINYGQWQGLTPDEVGARWPDALATWYAAPHQAHIPGGEALDELRSRAMATVDELSAHHAGQTIVLVGHTVINRVILLAILGLGNDRFWRIKQDTCAINVFEVENRTFTLVSLNDTCHMHSLKAQSPIS